MTTAIRRFNGIIKELNVSGATKGSLSGLKFVAKDLFDVKGEVTGIGNPTWAKTHGPALANAWAVDRVLNAGATLVGKSCSDEFAFSVDGINVHFGAPDNPQYPDRIAGGSSSGSGSAVAAGLVDFALGTDTGGSIRVPASYCGIYGFRPSHGRIPVDGVVPLAPLLDAVGWFARNSLILETVGSVLLNENRSAVFPKKLLIARDTFELISKRLKPAVEKAVEAFASKFAQAQDVHLEPYGWEGHAKLYRVFQGRQAWKIYGDWITQNDPYMCPSIKERFDFTKTVTEKDFEDATEFRNRIVSGFAELLAGDTVLCMPTTSDLPPLIDASEEDLLRNRARNMNLTGVAPLARVPEVCVPIPLTEKTTTGLSFLASHGNDMMLLNLCRGLLQS
ncbi:MAG: amidase [Candidatus Melainabacteria bacterium]|nr:amidase [Candidatus Melainabacteria bacterium]